MTKETMTVHEALAELKTLDKRIDKKIRESTYANTCKESGDAKVGIYSKESFKEITRQNYQSVRDLINRRNALKRAVVFSNAKTNVEIGGVTYTVAEAIDMKNHGMGHLRSLLIEITEEYNHVATECRKTNETLVDRATHSLQQLSGGENKIEAEEVQKFIDEFTKSQRLEVISGIDCPKIMAELEEEIATFSTKIDSALSVSNAITTIEFEY